MKKAASHLKKPQQLWQSSRFNFIVLTIFALSMGVAGYFIIFSKAAPAPPTIYLSPASQTLAPNTTFTVSIRENSGTTAVNAVQANLTYDPAKLDFVSIDDSNSAFTIEAQSGGGSGLIAIGRGKLPPALTGDQLVAVLTFKTKTSAGASNVSFVNGSQLLNSTTNTDILPSLSATGGGTFTVDTGGPTVNITTPVSSPTQYLRGTTTLSANATDPAGVRGVQFKVNGNNIGTEDTTSPYSISWNTTTTADGIYSLTAVATDTGGNPTTSNAVGVVVDNTPPTVTVGSPGTVTSGSFTATADIGTDPAIAGVQFKVDGNNSNAEDTTSPYSTLVNTSGMTNGTHTLAAVARDKAGNTTTSATVNFTVSNTVPDTTAPSVSLTAPAAGATVNGSNVTVSGTASDNSGGSGLDSVQIRISGGSFGAGANLGPAHTNSPFSYSWNTTTIANGSYTLTAVATDNANNTTTSASRTVTVNNQTTPDPDSTAPSVPSGLSSSAKTTSSVSLRWNASSDPSVSGDATSGLAGYKIYRNGSFLTSTTLLTYTDSGLTANTSYSYQVTSYDNANNESTKSTSLAVTTNANPPTVNLTASPTAVNSGSSATLTWSSTNATSCTASGSWSGAKNTSGSQAVTPTTSSLYTLTCSGSGGSANDSATVTINSTTTPPTPPPTPPTPPPTPPTPPPSSKFCDFTGDRLVDVYDLSILLTKYNSHDATTDVNDDGVVNVYDLSILLSNYGK